MREKGCTLVEEPVATRYQDTPIRISTIIQHVFGIQFILKKRRIEEKSQIHFQNRVSEASSQRPIT